MKSKEYLSFVPNFKCLVLFKFLVHVKTVEYRLSSNFGCFCFGNCLVEFLFNASMATWLLAIESGRGQLQSQKGCLESFFFLFVYCHRFCCFCCNFSFYCCFCDCNCHMAHNFSLRFQFPSPHRFEP